MSEETMDTVDMRLALRDLLQWVERDKMKDPLNDEELETCARSIKDPEQKRFCDVILAARRALKGDPQRVADPVIEDADFGEVVPGIVALCDALNMPENEEARERLRFWLERVHGVFMAARAHEAEKEFRKMFVDIIDGIKASDHLKLILDFLHGYSQSADEKKGAEG